MARTHRIGPATSVPRKACFFAARPAGCGCSVPVWRISNTGCCTKIFRERRQNRDFVAEQRFFGILPGTSRRRPHDGYHALLAIDDQFDSYTAALICFPFSLRCTCMNRQGPNEFIPLTADNDRRRMPRGARPGHPRRDRLLYNLRAADWQRTPETEFRARFAGACTMRWRGLTPPQGTVAVPVEIFRFRIAIQLFDHGREDGHAVMVVDCQGLACTGPGRGKFRSVRLSRTSSPVAHAL